MASPNKHNVQFHSDLLVINEYREERLLNVGHIEGLPDSRFYFCENLKVCSFETYSDVFTGKKITRHIPDIDDIYNDEGTAIINRKLKIDCIDFTKNHYKFQVVRFRVPYDFELGVAWIDKNQQVQFFYDNPYKQALSKDRRDWWGYMCVDFEPTDKIIRGRDETQNSEETDPPTSLPKTGGYNQGQARLTANSFTQCQTFMFVGCKTKFLPIFRFRSHFFIPTRSMNETMSFYAMEHKDSLKSAIKGLRQFTPIPNPKDLGIGVMGEIYSDNILAIDFYKDAKVLPNRL